MAGSIGEVQLDALPYWDQGYEEPGVREMVCLKRLVRCTVVFYCFGAGT